MDIILFILLIALFARDILPKIFAKDKASIWSPITFLCVYLTYYVLIPYLKGGGNASKEAQIFLLVGTVLFYVVFRFFFLRSKPKYEFKTFNKSVDTQNAVPIALWLFVIAFIGYGIFNGFNLSIFITTIKENVAFDENASYGHTEMYITSLISVFTFSCAIIYTAKNKFTAWGYLLLGITLIIYIIGGFRYRILILLVTTSTVIYLYPRPSKIKYHILLPIAVVVYLAMGLLEATRVYNQGIDIQALQNWEKSDKKEESIENVFVYEFSAECMGKYTINNLILFDPIATAVCMPIPRSLFPSKPKGLYMRDANMKIYGTIEHGAAFLNITEAYISFWWFGIIAYAAFLGWLSKLFWLNYLRNSSSIGSICLLGLYNGTLYQIIARGYMAQGLTTFIYYVFVPYWLIFLLKRIKLLKPA